MKIQIGSVIRRLRTEKGITQDGLANAIGITPQAISRWESENAYPDIELLPAIADFFAVSIDELMGYQLSEREQILAGIKKEIARIAETGTIEERICYAREAATRFPTDYELKENLAVCLWFRWCETGEQALYDEIEQLCKMVVENCNDSVMVCDAINTLRGLYAGTGQPDKALWYINKLLPMECCRESILANGIGDGRTAVYLQEVIDKHVDGIGLAIQSLVLAEEEPNDTAAWEEKIELLTIACQLYLLIYGEELKYHHERLSRLLWLRSTYQMAQGKTEEALCSLEEMAKHALSYDGVSVHNHAYYMLEYLKDERYQPIKNNIRFLKIVNELTAGAY